MAPPKFPLPGPRRLASSTSPSILPCDNVSLLTLSERSLHFYRVGPWHGSESPVYVSSYFLTLTCSLVP